jgi:Cu/Ag efflux pump CusA
MIRAIIAYSVRNRALVLLLTVILTALGIWGVYGIRLDAIPDLSDVQVIVVTEYPGQNPQVVDDQVTYPLATRCSRCPGATVVRGCQHVRAVVRVRPLRGRTDIYWARSRVLEYLNFDPGPAASGVEPTLGPDATGVGWVYQYACSRAGTAQDHPKGSSRMPGQAALVRARDAPPERGDARASAPRGSRAGARSMGAISSSDQDLGAARSAPGLVPALPR